MNSYTLLEGESLIEYLVRYEGKVYRDCYKPNIWEEYECYSFHRHLFLTIIQMEKIS